MDFATSSEPSMNFWPTTPRQILVDRNLTKVMPLITGATGNHIKASERLEDTDGRSRNLISVEMHEPEAIRVLLH
jgi:hypothetical protein